VTTLLSLGLMYFIQRTVAEASHPPQADQNSK